MYSSSGRISTQCSVLKTRLDTGGKKKKQSMRKRFHDLLTKASRMRSEHSVLSMRPSRQPSRCTERMVKHVSGTAMRRHVAESTVAKSPS